MSTLVQFVSWFSLPVSVVLTGLLIWRGVLRKFPNFFAYIAIGVIVGFVRFWLYYARPRAYSSFYWTSDVLAAFIVLLATSELLMKRLFPRFYTVRLYQFLFPIAALVLTLFLVPAALQNHKVSILRTIIHVSDVLRVTMLLFLVGLMLFMGRRWSRYELGIAMGLVVQASALLATSAVWTKNVVVHHVLDFLPPVSYDISSVIWLITFLKPEKPTLTPSGPITPALLTEARKWQEAAKGSVTGKTDPD